MLFIALLVAALVLSCKSDFDHGHLFARNNEVENSIEEVPETEHTVDIDTVAEEETVPAAEVVKPEIPVDLLHDAYEVGIISRMITTMNVAMGFAIHNIEVINGVYDLVDCIISGTIHYSDFVYESEFYFNGDVDFSLHYKDGESTESAVCNNLTFKEIDTGKSYVFSFDLEYLEHDELIEVLDFVCNGVEYQDYINSYTYGYL